MKRNLLITLAIGGMLFFAGQLFTIAAHPGSHDKNAFTPETIPWGPPPPFIAPGAQLAVIEGDPGRLHRQLHRALENARRLPDCASLASLA